MMRIPYVSLSCTVGLFARVARTSSNPNLLVLPPEALYNLPVAFVGNVSQAFLQTTQLPGVNGSTVLQPFVAYDNEFISLLAPNATLELLYADPDGNAVGHEMGIWVWDHNQVWMASVEADGSSSVNILNLDNNTITPLVPSNGVSVLNPNGGSYHDGKVYIAGDGNATAASCIYAIDPVTYEVEVTIDSYFGLRLNGPNDLTWATRTTLSCNSTSRSWLFFTDANLRRRLRDHVERPDTILWQ